MIAKTEGWETRLARYIDSRAGAPFRWGSHDCCLFVAGAVEAMTGCASLRGDAEYRSAVGAARLLGEWRGIMELPARHGLAELASVKLAMRGDVVATATATSRSGRELIALGVCCGESSAFAGATGVTMLPTLRCLRAWRVA